MKSVLLLSAGLLLSLAASVAWAKPRIEMELCTEPSFPLAGGQQWFKLLTERGVTGLQIRPLGPNDKVAIDARGPKDSPTYHVTGLLTDRNQLLVPGGQFSLGDAGAIAKWLAELSENGPDAVTQQKTAFGLTAKQLDQLHADLAKPVDFSTKKRPPAEVIEKIKSRLTTPLSIEPAAQQALAGEEPVRDELQGVGSGAALAAVLRPAGLILLPRKLGGREPDLTIVSAKGANESWPIGWPPQQKGADLVPMLFQTLDADIDDVPAAQVLEVLEGRLKVPFLFDHNSLVRNRIDLGAVKVTVPGKRSYYNRVLQQVLIKSGLQSELRVDEAGKPLFWITTVKKS